MPRARPVYREPGIPTLAIKWRFARQERARLKRICRDTRFAEDVQALAWFYRHKMKSGAVSEHEAIATVRDLQQSAETLLKKLWRAPAEIRALLRAVDADPSYIDSGDALFDELAGRFLSIERRARFRREAVKRRTDTGSFDRLKFALGSFFDATEEVARRAARSGSRRGQGNLIERRAAHQLRDLFSARKLPAPTRRDHGDFAFCLALILGIELPERTPRWLQAILRK